MAVGTPTELASVFANAGSGTITTAAFNIADGAVAIVMGHADNNNVGTFSHTFGTLSLTSRMTDAGGSRMEVLTMTGDATSASSTGTVSLTRGGGTSLHVVGITNATEAPTNTKEKAWASSTNSSVVLDSAIAATSVMMAFEGMSANITPTTDATATELIGSDGSSHYSSSNYDEATTDTIAFTHSGTNTIILAFEITEAGGGGGFQSAWAVNSNVVIQ